MPQHCTHLRHLGPGTTSICASPWPSKKSSSRCRSLTSKSWGSVTLRSAWAALVTISCTQRTLRWALQLTFRHVREPPTRRTLPSTIGTTQCSTALQRQFETASLLPLGTTHSMCTTCREFRELLKHNMPRMGIRAILTEAFRPSLTWRTWKNLM